MDKSHTVAQLVRAFLANSKVLGSSPGGVTDDFFLSFISGLQVLSFGEKRAVRGISHVASSFLKPCHTVGYTQSVGHIIICWITALSTELVHCLHKHNDVIMFS